MNVIQNYLSRRVCEIDCCQDQDSRQYFESHPTTVCSTAIGRYRECGNIKFSRFAYRFTISQIQRPHVVSIEYPDDKERTFCIMDGRTYDLSSGVATGREIPVSGKMITHNIIFWPRWQDCTVMFVTWDPKAPAAVSKINVFELDEKYFEENRGPARKENHRQIGFKWEDPGGRYSTMGAVRRPDWSKRVAAYASAAGQTLIQHPITWYWGCLYPSAVDKTDYLEGIVDENSTLYICPLHSVYDWVAETLDDLGQKDLDFMGVFHVYRFHNLLKAAQQDNSIRNVNYNGTTQLSTLDWTRTWTSFNIPLMADSEGYKGSPEDIRDTAYECTDGMKEIPSDILGEPMGKLEGFCAPIFNCLHPAVEKHLLALMAELNHRYGGYKNFKGITLPLWGATFVWFSTLRTGYDDATFLRFERESGLSSGISSTDPERFSKRYQWVTKHHLQDWITWRCAKIRSLLGRMQKTLAGTRNDVRLVVSAWREPLLAQILVSQTYHAHLSYHSESVQLCNSGDLVSILRQGGIDPALFDGRDGVELELLNDPYRDRSLEINSGKNARSNSLRDHDFLDRTTNDLFSRQQNRNVFIFNCYYESGRYVIGKAETNALQRMKDYGSGLNDSIHTMYLVFDHQTWPWFEHEFTTCPGVPASGRNFLECYAHAVAEMDAKTITFGGLLIGSFGHEDELKEFSRAFTFLPADPFETTPSNSDAVVVRYLTQDGGNYLYLINAEPSAMDVTVTFDRAGAVLRSPDGTDRVAEAIQSFSLAPYELRAYRMSAGKPLKAEIKITNELASRIQRAASLLSEAQSVKTDDGKWRPWLIEELTDCLNQQKHRRLRHLFRSYPAQKLIGSAE